MPSSDDQDTASGGNLVSAVGRVPGSFGAGTCMQFTSNHRDAIANATNTLLAASPVLGMSGLTVVGAFAETHAAPTLDVTLVPIVTFRNSSVTGMTGMSLPWAEVGEFGKARGSSTSSDVSHSAGNKSVLV